MLFGYDGYFSLFLGVFMILFRKSAARQSLKWQSRIYRISPSKLKVSGEKPDFSKLDIAKRFQEKIMILGGVSFIFLGLLVILGIIKLGK